MFATVTHPGGSAEWFDGVVHFDCDEIIVVVHHDDGVSFSEIKISAGCQNLSIQVAADLAVRVDGTKMLPSGLRMPIPSSST